MSHLDEIKALLDKAEAELSGPNYDALLVDLADEIESRQEYADDWDIDEEGEE
jgi:hypothetical protein